MLILNTCPHGEELLVILSFVHKIITLIQIFVPIGLIIWGSIDLGKAVIAGEEKEIKTHQKTLLKRALAGVLIFFIVAIVTFATGLVGGEDWKACWDAAKTGEYELEIN